jgi:putative ABC transport system permease protein
MTILWLSGLLRRRWGRLAGATMGIALTVAMLVALDLFLAQSAATMTRRATANVEVDWQVQCMPGATVEPVLRALQQSAVASSMQAVDYADVSGFEAHTGSTVQTTGPGKVLGIGTTYSTLFPRQLRLLLGSLDGVLVAQQTAANLHVSIGDTVTIARVGLPAVQVAIDGIVDLPAANSLFQEVGVTAAAAPPAPPDNVLLVPLTIWHTWFDPQARLRPDSIRHQVHVGLARAGLPPRPENAYAFALGAAKNLEARLGGDALVANNLAARLDAVRSDALYASLVFLSLGAPGAALAALLTVAVANAGSERRRRDQALLRLRGASQATILRLAASEAIAVGIAGACIGLGLAVLMAYLLFGSAMSDSVPGLAGSAVALVAGLLLALAAVLVPCWIDARHLTVSAGRTAIEPDAPRLWRRLHLDYLLLALAALVFWHTWRNSYQIVLAPEGVAASQVDYLALLAPLCYCLGAALLTLRLGHLSLGRGRPLLTVLLTPVAGLLSSVVAASMSRQRRRIASGAVLVALAFAFGVSTSIFNATYQAQATVDAELTNGADVAVTGSMSAPASAMLKALATIPGVTAAQPLQRRLAYVGNDLQDLFGVDPRRIQEVTHIADAYFQNGSARATLSLLAMTPDGALVSEETVKDFQLQPGDELNLRLQDGIDHQYHVVKFRFIGVVREFPTAPHDSFIVANAKYVAEQTHAAGAEAVLLKASVPDAQVASAARQIVAGQPGMHVSGISQAVHLIGSSLTAVDLTGLTRLELLFALTMIAAACGLMLALNFEDRHRSFAILAALGAKPRQIGSFLWSEALFVALFGALVGTAVGAGLAVMLIKLLSGVFDPPPDNITVPWLYVTGLIAIALLSIIFAATAFQRVSTVAPVQRMREP